MFTAAQFTIARMWKHPRGPSTEERTKKMWYIYTMKCSVSQSCLTLYDPMDCSTLGFSVHHQVPELAHTHVHQVGDAIQPSHPLLSPSPALNLSRHQDLFQ